MLVLIDNYDSFTYNLVHYFEEIGEKVKVFRKITSITTGSSVGSGNVEIGKDSQPVFYNDSRDINLISSKRLSISLCISEKKDTSLFK